MSDDMEKSLIKSHKGKSLFHVYLRITAVVVLYWTVSIVTVFLNKNLLSNENLEAPFFILWYQCFVSVVICLIIKCFSTLYPHKFPFPNGSPISREGVFNVSPVSILFTLMIVFNALCLKYANVSFYYIGRSLTTVFNVTLTYIVLGQVVSRNTIICCAIIVFGFVLGVDQENLLGTFSFIGTLSGVLSSLFLAMYSVYTKKVLPFVGDSILMFSYYNNFYSCILLVPCILVNGEISKLIQYNDIFHFHFWTLMTISGIFGFLIGFVTSLQIKVTSPLTHNISGTAKACFQTLLATIWYNELKTSLWWLSNYVVLFGSFAYARVKQKELAQAAMVRNPSLN